MVFPVVGKAFAVGFGIAESGCVYPTRFTRPCGSTDMPYGTSSPVPPRYVENTIHWLGRCLKSSAIRNMSALPAFFVWGALPATGKSVEVV